MSVYEKVSKDLSFAERELDVLNLWQENNVFEKSIEARKDAPVFTFYDGPPTANGKPHIGHVLTRAIKDLIPRYKTMKGYKVLRKAGWDTHGLPVELEVEKLLGISGKPEIEKYGVEPFIKKCKESVWKYEAEWRKMSERVGFWADMNEPYVTYHNEYIESVWWALKTIWDKGLIYKGHKVVPYCPRCGTALSSHEVAQGYADVKEKSVYVKFKIVDGGENEFFLAWTTTPWTLPSNVALIVNAKETYVKAKFTPNGETYVLAEALAEKVLGEGNYEIIEKMKGSDLEYKKYEPMFKFLDFEGKTSHIVTCDPYVTLADGTGIVHCAPAFGEDDSRVGKKYKLEFVQLVDAQGNFVSGTDYAGMFVKDADPKIIEDLKANGVLFREADYEHSYPFCWRCDTPLIYYARDTWFIEMTKVRDNLLKNNETVNWLPDNIKHGRFGSFLENVVDWGLSRERYWGTPLPIWECSCGKRHMIGSVEELRKMAIDAPPQDLELHKPYIDNVFLKCEDCGGSMKRVTEVIDCWFDSGSMPFAQWHYPFENKELFDENFPADFISEAIDQTRGWFYSLLAISTVLFDKSPYENVVVLGHVQDKDGQKMSKHKNNVVDPFVALEKQGADAARWYFYFGSSPWLPSRFYEEAVSEGQRKFLGTLWNSYAFYILYAGIDGFNPLEHKIDEATLDITDKWVLSKLNTLIQFVDKNMEEYRITESARAMNDFVDELSNWYLRRNRERFWASGMEQDKINAYLTLYKVLYDLIRVAAPFTPFITETIYQNIVRSVDKSAPVSVHLCDYPVCDSALIDADLESKMDLTLKVVTLGRSARNKANIKNRQPIGKMYVKAEGTLDEMFSRVAANELNVKNVEFITDMERFSTYKFKPQLKTLGKKAGKLLPKLSEFLTNVDGNEFMAEIRKATNDKPYNVTIEETEIPLTEEDLLIEIGDKLGFVGDSDAQVTVVFDVELTPELIEEGFVREIVSKLQTMRKEADFEVLDRIDAYYESTPAINGVFERNSKLIAAEVLADNVIFGKADGGYVKEWSINGEDAVFGVFKK